MTGAGAPGGPGIIKCLKLSKDIDLMVCDANEYASGRFLNEKFILCPAASDISFIDFMLDSCLKHKIDVVFPLVTKELFLFSKYKTEFEKIGTKIIVSDFEALEIANNKSLLHLHLQKNGILTPKFEVINDFEELIDKLNLFLSEFKSVCIKPSVSNGSRGVRIIDPSADEHDLLFNHKPNSLYISKENLLAILSKKKFPQLLLAEMLPGEEYTVDTLINNGEIILIVPRIRSKMNGGISVAGTIEFNKEIAEHIKSIAKTLKMNGPIGFQFKKDENGLFKILEINPRIQGTSVALLGAGINLPLLSVYQELMLKIEIPEIKWGVNFVRYYEELFY